MLKLSRLVSKLTGETIDRQYFKTPAGRTICYSFVVAGIWHLLAGIFTTGYFHYDEHYQILEFAAYKLGLCQPQDLPWEFEYQIRPALQPAIVYLFNITGLFDPGQVVLILRLAMSGLALIALYGLTLLAFRWIKDTGARKFMLWAAGLIWFLPFQHARFTSENASAIAFIFGLLMLIISLDKSKKYWLSGICIGFLFGLAFVLRFQSAFLIAGTLLYVLVFHTKQIHVLMPIFFGSLVPIGLGVLIDRWFYDEWTSTTWNYLQAFLNTTRQFDTSPPWGYFQNVWYKAKGINGQLIVFGVVAFWVFRPKHIVTWITAIFVLIYSLISHKEGRFLWPIAFFLPLMLAGAYESLAESQNFLRHIAAFLRNKWFVGLLIIANLIGLPFASLQPAETDSELQIAFARLAHEPQPIVYTSLPPALESELGCVPVTYYHNRNWTIWPIATLLLPAYHKPDCYYLAIEEGRLTETIAPLTKPCELVYQSPPYFICEFCENFNVFNPLKINNIWQIYRCGCQSD